MTRRIKSGLRKAKKNPNNPLFKGISKFVNPSWVGFAERGAIEKLTGRSYEDVKKDVLDGFVQLLLGGLTKK